MVKSDNDTGAKHSEIRPKITLINFALISYEHI